MKKFISILCLLSVISADAGILSSNLFSPQSVSATTNTGAAVQLGTVILPSTTFAIQNLGVTSTNQMAVDIYAGFSTNALSQVGTYTTLVTNSTIDSFLLTNSSAVPIYFQAKVRVTTNSATVGVQAIIQR